MMPTKVPIVSLMTTKTRTRRRKKLVNCMNQKKWMMQKVLAELKQETGIDYLALLTGDEKEKRRAKFQDHQDARNY
jgi:hypothetical protein